MKKLATILAIIMLGVFATSCATMKHKKHMKEMHLTAEEEVRFSIKGDTILYDSVQVAYVQNIEWEYIGGEKDMRMEISLTQINPYDTEITRKLIKFVHGRHPKAKIEVNYDEEEEIDYN